MQPFALYISRPAHLSCTTMLFLVLMLVAKAAAEFATIQATGNKFFNSSLGDQFFIKGIAYQRSRKVGDGYESLAPKGYIDSLAYPHLCLRDVDLLRELGVNAVRVYQVDPEENHDVCMHVFQRYGIYVMVDLLEPKNAINRADPSWDTELMDHYKLVVDAMHLYPNVLGFVVGNEVVTNWRESPAAPFVKAAVRDVKSYIRQKKYRQIPVGYTSNDDVATRNEVAKYMVCTDKDSGKGAPDFYGINMFEWCGDLSYDTSGYKQRTLEFSEMPVPIFFSEYGCNTVRPRPFTEMAALYGPTMSKLWSGGFIFEFFQNVNGYGLVDERNGRLVPLDDFNTVKFRFLESVPHGAHTVYAAQRVVDRACPAVAGRWLALPLLPPTPNEEKCRELYESLTCVAREDVKTDHVLDHVCSHTDCSPITHNATSGRYGKWLSCLKDTRLSWALNEHYLDHGLNSLLCSFNGSAHLVTRPVHHHLHPLPSVPLKASPASTPEPLSADPDSGAVRFYISSMLCIIATLLRVL